MQLHLNLSIGFFASGTLILFLLYWRFWSLKKREPGNIFAELFSRLVLFCAIAVGIYSSFFILFADNPFFLWIGHALGEPFLLVGFVHGFVIFLTFVKPGVSTDKTILSLSLLAVVSSLFFHFIFPFHPYFDENGLLYWNANVYVGINFSAWAIFGFLPLSVALFLKGLKEKGGKVRSFLLSVAIFLHMVSGIATFLGTNNILITVFTFLQMIAFLLLSLAIIKRWSLA